MDYAGIAGLYAACGLTLGCGGWNRSPDRPLASFPFRAIPLIAGGLLLLGLDTRIVLVANENFMRDYGDGFAVLELLVLAGLGGAAAVLGWRERASLIRERTPRS